MSNLSEQAGRLATMAIGFNHPMIPAQGRAVVHESARLIHEMALQLDQIKAQLQMERELRKEQGEMIQQLQEVNRYEQTAQR